MQSDGKEWNQALALSFKEKWSKRSRIASLETSFNFSASHTSKKTERCKFGSSKGVPPNWECCIMEISAGLSSKLLASTAGRVMLEAIPWTLVVMKSQRVLLSLPDMLEFLLASCLYSSILYFFLLKRKVLSISRSGLHKIRLCINKEKFLQALSLTLPAQLNRKKENNEKTKQRKTIKCLVTFVR